MRGGQFLFVHFVSLPEARISEEFFRIAGCTGNMVQHLHLWLCKQSLPATLCLVFLQVLLMTGNVTGSDHADTLATPNILLLNSYHKGYSWSDQLVNGVENTLLHTYPKADIRVEYMDTKRNNSAWYLNNLARFYAEKFRDVDFDLIIASDDNAIAFMMAEGENIFPGIPVVFCGANTIDVTTFMETGLATGVLENNDIRTTLELAVKLQPEIREVYVINDNTTTGLYTSKELDRVIAGMQADLRFIKLTGKPLDELADKVSTLPEKSIVLLLAYLRDEQGTYHDPQVTASTLSAVSSVPIYSVWNFFFNYGITGGVLTSGYRQGELAGQLGLKILAGNPPASMPIIASEANEILFDYRQMIRFGLPIEELPKTAQVKHISYGNEKNVLVLNSYSADNLWTRAVMEGIEEQLDDSGVELNIYTEFMDTKRFTDMGYLQSLTDLLTRKYSHQGLDMVIVSDDNAFNFVRRYRPLLFKDVPVVFCGVNHLPNPGELTKSGMTGVIESYDILGTLQLGIELFPATRTIYVVNDTTTTGLANRKRLENIIDALPEGIRVKYSEPMSMKTLLDEVASLDSHTLVLLMSFTTDKDNYRFSFAQSAGMITASSARPVLGFWDFYLGNGILGGAVTSGLDQGRTAGDLALSIINGRDTVELPVVEQSPVVPTIDFDVARRFGLAISNMPAGVRVLNMPLTFYGQHKSKVQAVIVIFLVLLGIVLFQAVRILVHKRDHLKLSEKAESDPLTGVKNREFFTTVLDQMIAAAIEECQIFTLCYFDLDNLKTINDNLGHPAGDQYILLAVDAMRQNLRKGDPLCRVGGDEFIALLTDCTDDKGRELCGKIEEDLLLAAESLDLSWEIGLSCGYAEFNPKNPLAPEDLVSRADQMMYQQKVARKASPARDLPSFSL